ncbi:AI-2E family transporter [Kallipyga massiliensis]|uniref:AI-2E family transporter n=1 Tax=Kallipyga massiliensis TaxID=1472764 RepID=UPI0004B891FA|nr:AI-2E family transporter [Kallipyga massiliensis]
MRFTKEEKQQIKLILFIITCSILIFMLLSNFNAILKGFGYLLGMISPFMMAIMVSFLVNIFMSVIENKILDKLPIGRGGKRALAILLSFILIVAILVLIFSLILPQLFNSLRTIILAIPDFLDKLSAFLQKAKWMGPVQKPLIDALDNLQSISLPSYLWHYISPQGNASFGSFIQSVLPTINAVFSGLLNAFLVLVFSIYMLAAKETLGTQAKQLLYASLPESIVDKFMYIFYTAYDNFYNFFTGQFREALTLGFMCFVGMKILGLPLALAVSVLIAFGALIPMVGAVLAGLIGTLTISSISLTQGLGFMVYIFVLQQFDGNIIYPRIVGQSVGLPAIWVLLAVIIGGSTMGIFGMLLFLPIFSTIYDLLSDFKTRRLAKKNINVAEK